MTDGGPTQAEEQAFATSRLDRDRTLRAVHGLEAALGMAAGGGYWLDQVTADLGALEMAMTEEQQELNRPDALLSLIAAEHPRRFGSRIRNLQEQYDDIIRQVGSLRSQLEDPEAGAADVGDLRYRTSSIVRALHHCRARQTDLVYEALSLDLGER